MLPWSTTYLRPGEQASQCLLSTHLRLSSEETAEILAILIATVKTRLFRGRHRLQEALAPELGTVLNGNFPSAGAECAALTAKGLSGLGL